MYYVAPTRTLSTILLHAGNLSLNPTGAITPDEFALFVGSVPVQSTIKTGVFPAPAFTHFSAGQMQAASYDELIVDILPTLTYTSGQTSVSTSKSVTTYQQLAAIGKPFWLLINLNGYGIPALYASATVAYNTALLVLNTIASDLINYHIGANFRGFAFQYGDLNIVYTDDSSPTRLMQNNLIQTCWQQNCACCFITARPRDYLSLIGPVIVGNVNSAAKLDNPILGCNVAQRDKLLVVYPNINQIGRNISVVIGQLEETLAAGNSDPGFTPNYDVAYGLYLSDTFFTPDGTMGATVNTSSTMTEIVNLFGFTAALGTYQLALANTGFNFPSAPSFLPPDAKVNTTGAATVYGDGGNVYVAYSDGLGGTIVRQFDDAFVETAYTGPTFP